MAIAGTRGVAARVEREPCRVNKVLAAHGMTVCDRSYAALLFAVNRAVMQASNVVVRQAYGDFAPDPEANRFPKMALPDPTKRFKPLWDEFCKSRNRGEDRARRSLHFFESLIEHVGSDDMRAVTEEHLLSWRDKLQASGLSRQTVKEGYFAAVKSFFRWAKRQKKLPVDPSAEVIIEMADDGKNMRGLTNEEARAILAASLGPFDGTVKANKYRRFSASNPAEREGNS
jgi:hypothetical protein